MMKCLLFQLAQSCFKANTEPPVVAQMLEGLSQLVVQYTEVLDYLEQYCSTFQHNRMTEKTTLVGINALLF